VIFRDLDLSFLPGPFAARRGLRHPPSTFTIAHSCVSHKLSFLPLHAFGPSSDNSHPRRNRLLAFNPIVATHCGILSCNISSQVCDSQSLHNRFVSCCRTSRLLAKARAQVVILADRCSCLWLGHNTYQGYPPLVPKWEDGPRNLSGGGAKRRYVEGECDSRENCGY